MKQFANKNGDIVVLQRGEELHTSLIAYAREHGLTSAWVTGLGGAGMMTLGYYNFETREYEWHDVDSDVEIVNLTGNLSIVDGEPFWHIHGTFGRADLTTIGGHVRELTVSLTCELHITPLETPMTRRFDDETGLKLLSETNTTP